MATQQWTRILRMGTVIGLLILRDIPTLLVITWRTAPLSLDWIVQVAKICEKGVQYDIHSLLSIVDSCVSSSSLLVYLFYPIHSSHELHDIHNLSTTILTEFCPHALSGL